MFRIALPASTLPPQLRGVFIQRAGFKLLRALGEAAPFDTSVWLKHGSVVGRLEDPDEWAVCPNGPVTLLAVGPHAEDTADLLPTAVAEMLATMEFDGDGITTCGGA